MPNEIAPEDMCRLVHEGPQLVEVLPLREYEEGHLPGAINIPLGHLHLPRATHP
jgi:rhodanese-related sulfurtransferase